MCTPRIGVAAGVITMTDQRTTFAALIKEWADSGAECPCG
jgi:hypothetical protein